MYRTVKCLTKLVNVTINFSQDVMRRGMAIPLLSNSIPSDQANVWGIIEHDPATACAGDDLLFSAHLVYIHVLMIVAIIQRAMTISIFAFITLLTIWIQHGPYGIDRHLLRIPVFVVNNCPDITTEHYSLFNSNYIASVHTSDDAICKLSCNGPNLPSFSVRYIDYSCLYCRFNSATILAQFYPYFQIIPLRMQMFYWCNYQRDQGEFLDNTIFCDHQIRVTVQCFWRVKWNGSKM